MTLTLGCHRLASMSGFLMPMFTYLVHSLYLHTLPTSSTKWYMPGSCIPIIDYLIPYITDLRRGCDKWPVVLLHKP